MNKKWDESKAMHLRNSYACKEVHIVKEVEKLFWLKTDFIFLKNLNNWKVCEREKWKTKIKDDIRQYQRLGQDTSVIVHTF